MSLLKRREAATEGLRKAKEQCQELRAKLGPLKDEEQTLRLQKTCLEERLRLMESQRKENVEHYRVRTRNIFDKSNFRLLCIEGLKFCIQETIDHLEENSRELKTELQIQMKKTEELEMLKNSMAKELLFYRQVQTFLQLFFSLSVLITVY